MSPALGLHTLTVFSTHAYRLQGNAGAKRPGL